jgi:hypothetical protein
MEQKVICGINGVGLYGIISILIFVTFFAGTLFWVSGLKKNYLKHMEDLPLDGSETNSTDKNQPENL